MPASRQTLYATSLALILAPISAPAQPLSWWDVITPDWVAENLLQYGVMALRTQIDLQYGDLTVNLLAGRATMTDLQIWPLPDWDPDAKCEISIDRLVIAQAPPDQSGRAAVQGQRVWYQRPGNLPAERCTADFASHWQHDRFTAVFRF